MTSPLGFKAKVGCLIRIAQANVMSFIFALTVNTGLHDLFGLHVLLKEYSQVA